MPCLYARLRYHPCNPRLGKSADTCTFINTPAPRAGFMPRDEPLTSSGCFDDGFILIRTSLYRATVHAWVLAGFGHRVPQYLLFSVKELQSRQAGSLLPDTPGDTSQRTDHLSNHHTKKPTDWFPYFFISTTPTYEQFVQEIVRRSVCCSDHAYPGGYGVGRVQRRSGRSLVRRGCSLLCG